MNALPVGPEHMAGADSRTRYFDDLERWGFDIAYCSFYATPFEDVVGKLKEAYSAFADEARKRGYPACIQIQSTVCAGDRVGIEEAQYDIANKPDKWGDNGFFASFSSDAWKDYLKELTTIFMRDYQFDYVVFEEPMYRVDIPGSKDRFYEKFTVEHPDVAYPEERAETPEYLLVQEAKAEALVDFYRDLTAHARAVGAGKIGIMPWFFIPTIENTPPGTLNPACEIGQLARISDLDFLVARMQPDNIYVDTMRTGDDMQKSPQLYYTEVMAHALGKDLIAVNNPSDEHTDHPACPLIPFEFFRDATLSSLAAAPCGFTRHWYGQNYGKDDSHMEVLAEAAKYASRLGQPVSPVAFVFSYSGTRHAQPLTYETVFPHYWALAKHMAFEAHLPMLTFHADTLDQNLAEHPEVQVLVLDEHFPLSPEQMMAIRRWWEGRAKRSVVAFGAGLGFVSDVNSPGVQPCVRSFPGVFELIGLKQEDRPQYESGQPLVLRDVSRIRRSAFLGDDTSLDIAKITNVRRVFGSRANVLYEADIEEEKIPVVAEWRDRSTLAVFCGFGLFPETVAAAEKAIRYALSEMDHPGWILDTCGDGILWNVNKNDFVVMSNLSDKKSGAVGRPGRAHFWDCREQKLLPDGDPQLDVEPKSFRVFRVVGRRSKFFDVLGASYLRGLIDGAGRAEIELCAGRTNVLVLRASPKEVRVDGRPCTITQEIVDGVYHVTLQQCPPGERRISLRW